MGVFVIAEIGINHNGDLSLAKKLIESAVEAGCDAVKFQKRTVDMVYSPEYLASYRESPWGNTQRAQKEGLEFDVQEYQKIDEWCKQMGIMWFASSWDLKAQRFIQQFSMKYNKVASAVLVNQNLLEMIAKEGKKTFISTGMSTWEEIDRAVAIFQNNNCPFELMHCNSTYPMEENEANLLVMDKIRERYGCAVGYSGHERGFLVTLAAVAKGASCVERHITLDRNLYGSDQKASLEPKELAEMVNQIRRLEQILGDGEKRLSSSELEIKKKLRG